MTGEQAPTPEGVPDGASGGGTARPGTTEVPGAPEAPGTPARHGVGRRGVIAGGAALVATAAAAGALRFTGGGGPSTGAIEARTVRAPVPGDDPGDARWDAARTTRALLQPQQQAPPFLPTPTIEWLDVKALFDGDRLAFRLEWEDAHDDHVEHMAAFRDAAAVMLPLSGGAEPPPIVMGSPERPVYIAQWKASWQHDVDDGFQDVTTAFPRWFNDVYPGHARLEGFGMDAAAARTFYPGLAVANPMSDQHRRSPVEELVAEGFGTLTTRAQQHAVGRGVHRDGRWRVAIGVSMEGEDAPALRGATLIPVAFALWDGAGQQVGSRKHFAGWIDLWLEGWR
jgi:hypothetical protein